MATLEAMQMNIGNALWNYEIEGVHYGTGKIIVVSDDGTEFVITIEGGADE